MESEREKSPCAAASALGELKKGSHTRSGPRITDEEPQQSSGQYPHLASSKIEFLFEKILTVTDASGMGRLVIPKAFAETYFPPLTQPKGIPLMIEDVNGNEWDFQFKCLSTGHSKVYSLDGANVTRFMQSMQLQADDSVTFNRSEPEGKFIMGYCKAKDSAATQGNSELNLQSSLRSGQKRVWNTRLRSKNLQSSSPSGLRRSKRLLNKSVDVPELKINREEAQELLRLPQSLKPMVFKPEDEKIEECDEPPVLRKKTVFVPSETGGQEQWVECDTCGNMHRLPVDTLLPPNWSCSDNLLDPARSFCSAPGEQDTLMQQTQEFKRMRMEPSNEAQEASALDTLANAGITVTGGEGEIAVAATNNNPNHQPGCFDTTANAGITITSEEGELTVAATTEHPSHQPGCLCIVCSQQPSGKGKHIITCTCTDCEIMKRRYKMLKMRKRNRGEAGQTSQQTQSEIRVETEVVTIPAVEPAVVNNFDLNTIPVPAAEPAAERNFDLNTIPEAE